MKCLKCCLLIKSGVTHYGLHPECFSRWFNARSDASFLSLARKANHSSDLSTQNTSFFHGKFKKYSAELEDCSYILKMREPEAPELPEVEYLCNQIGRMLEIPVADFYLIHFNEENVFVTKNFIKPTMPTDLQHIYHFRAGDQHSCEGLIQVVIKNTKRPYDIKILIHTILFDALIGNHDRHGRNLGFIVTSKETSLSPIYDNVSYLSLEKGSMLKADFNPTGKISTKKTHEPTMRDYAEELKRLGYHQELHAFYLKIKLPALLQLIHDSFCSPLMKTALENLVTKRFEELEGELQN